MTPTKAELAAHQRRQAERRRQGEAFLAQVAAEKGRPARLSDFHRLTPDGRWVKDPET